MLQVFCGEIWRCNKGWQQLESPTNVILNKVKVVRDDLIYVCGQQGMLLVGTDNVWSIVDHGSTTDQIWDLEWR